MIKGNKVGAVDLTTLLLVKTMDVQAAPQAVLVPPEGVAAYISSDASRKIAVLDLKAWKSGKLIEVGAGADGLAGSRRIDSSHHH